MNLKLGHIALITKLTTMAQMTACQDHIMQSHCAHTSTKETHDRPKEICLRTDKIKSLGVKI